MAFSSSTLASGLEVLAPTNDVNVVIGRIVDAWVSYFAGSSCNGIPAVSAVIEGSPKSAMTSALAGLSTPGTTAATIASGIQAFWTACLGTEQSIWPQVAPNAITPGTLVVPPGLSALSADIQTAFTQSAASGSTLAEAASSLAAAIHGDQVGAQVTISTPSGPVTGTIL